MVSGAKGLPDGDGGVDLVVAVGPEIHRRAGKGQGSQPDVRIESGFALPPHLPARSLVSFFDSDISSQVLLPMKIEDITQLKKISTPPPPQDAIYHFPPLAVCFQILTPFYRTVTSAAAPFLTGRWT